MVGRRSRPSPAGTEKSILGGTDSVEPGWGEDENALQGYDGSGYVPRGQAPCQTSLFVCQMLLSGQGSVSDVSGWMLAVLRSTFW